MPASDSSRSKKKRQKQKLELPSQLLQGRVQLMNDKAKVKQLSRRLEDKEFDDHIRNLNKDRVKKCRERIAKQLAL